MRKGVVDIITLGCSKNLIDSERLLRQFAEAGFTARHEPERLAGEVVVINTCGFIQSAKEESIETILAAIELKKSRRIGKLIVMGCLSERYMAELKAELPEVDSFYGKFNWREIITDLGYSYNPLSENRRVISTPPHSAYLKVSEGCSRSCAYCAIPIITGKHISRQQEDILEEARILVEGGVKEINLIAQDLTFYGVDIYKKQTIAELVDKMAEIDGLEWLRLHYAYPHKFPKDLLEVIARNPNVCNYLDMALQHISDPMLRAMRRNITRQETYDLIEEIRAKVPNIHLRTTLMVGFPGETEQDFEELMEFTSEMRFERMGAFAYSHEDGTFAAKNFEDNVPFEEKQRRLDELMKLQEGSAEQVSASKVGQTLKVLIDKREGDYYIGRTEFDSPEVDCEVLIPADAKKIEIGNFYQVKITDSMSFDLFGEVV